MDLDAVGWRPARRLRHVTAVRLHNLHDAISVGVTSYFYELRTWDVQRGTWTPFYRSEQLPASHDLDWGRQLLDPESKTAINGLQHCPDVGPLRLQVYADGGDGGDSGITAKTAPALCCPLSAPLRARQAAARGPAPSDYEAQHLPRLRRERSTGTHGTVCGPGVAPPLPPPALLQPYPDNVCDCAVCQAGSAPRLRWQPGPSRIPCVSDELTPGETTGPPQAQRPGMVSDASSARGERGGSNGGREARPYNQEIEGNALEQPKGTAAGMESSLQTPPLERTLQAGQCQQPAEQGQEERNPGGTRPGACKSFMQEQQRQGQGQEHPQDGNKKHQQQHQKAPQEIIGVHCGADLQEGFYRCSDLGDSRTGAVTGAEIGAPEQGPAHPPGPGVKGASRGSESSDSAGSGSGSSRQSRSSGFGAVPQEASADKLSGGAGDGSGSGGVGCDLATSDEMVAAVVEPCGRGTDAPANTFAVAQPAATVTALEQLLGAAAEGAAGCGCTGDAVPGSRREPLGKEAAPPQDSVDGDWRDANGRERPAARGGDSYIDGYDGRDGGAWARQGADGGRGGARLLLEHVFELRDLVPLEPRTLRRGWHTNLPVLLLDPDRRPFVPPSALPPPPPPAVVPQPHRQRVHHQQAATAAASGGAGGGSGGNAGRWRFGGNSACAGNGGPPDGYRRSVGGGGGGGGGGSLFGSSGTEAEDTAAAASAGGSDRPVNDKRALLRWLLSSSSVVQPLQVTGSLEDELQDDQFLAAAAAETAAGDGQQATRPPHCHHHNHAHHRSLSAADAAALLDPGPAPGFLPSALAVLFGQDNWSRAAPPGGGPAAAAGAPAEPPGGLRPPLPGLASGLTAAAGPPPLPGRAGLPADRRVASLPSLAVVAGTGTAGAPSATEYAVASSRSALASDVVGLAAPTVTAHGSLLGRSGSSAGELAPEGGSGVIHLSAPQSASSSTASFNYTSALGGMAGAVLTWGADSQMSLAGMATSMAATAGCRSVSAPPPPLPQPPPPQLSSHPAEGNHGAEPPAGVALQSRLPVSLQPPLVPSAMRLSGSTDSLSAMAAGATGSAVDARSGGAAAPEPAAAGGGASCGGRHPSTRAAAPPAVQRMCDLMEVWASIRRLTQLQERLTATRAGALAMRRRLEAAAERRQRADERRARAEAARAEGREWATRAGRAEAALRDLRAAALRRRRELQDRARALEAAARALQGAEQRRLVAEEQLEGPSGRGQMASLTAALVGRRNRLVSELGRIFQLGPVAEALLEPAPLDLTLDSGWAGGEREPGPGPELGQELGGRGLGAGGGTGGSFAQRQAQQPAPGAAAGAVAGTACGAPTTSASTGAANQEAAAAAVPSGQRVSGGGSGAVSMPAAPALGRVHLRGSGGPLSARGGPTRLAVMGLELPPDLIDRSLQGPAGWSLLDLGRRYDADQRTAACLGYLAAIVDLAAAYLGVPLRYPVAPRVSVSYISDPVPPSASVRSGAAGPVAGPPSLLPAPLAAGSGDAAAGFDFAAPGAEWRLLSIATGSLSSAIVSVTAAATGGGGASPPPPPAVGVIPGPRGVGVDGRLAVFSSLLNAQLDPWVAGTPAGAVGDDAHPAGLNPAAGLPLFWGDGARDRTRFAYAVYLLCKDIEQLLAAHGIPPVAPNQPLPNLYVLVTAAASGVPRPIGGGAAIALRAAAARVAGDAAAAGISGSSTVTESGTESGFG